jgi:hypothetical protein
MSINRKNWEFLVSSFTNEGRVLTNLSGFSKSYVEPELVAWSVNQAKAVALPVPAKL